MWASKAKRGRLSKAFSRRERLFTPAFHHFNRALTLCQPVAAIRGDLRRLNKFPGSLAEFAARRVPEDAADRGFDEPAQAETPCFRDDSRARRFIALTVFHDLLEELPFHGWGDHFRPADHYPNEFAWRRVEGERENLVGPFSRQHVEHAQALFAEPGIIPGLHHRLGLLRIKLLPDQSSLHPRADFPA